MNYVMLAANAAENATKRTNWNIYSWLLDKYDIAETQTALILMLVGVVLCIVIPYLIGSINPAIIFSKKFYNDDIRTHGSGNAGATNILRTFGPKMAALIFCLDLCKAALAVGFGSILMTREIGGAIAGLFVILGHMFPIFYKFKGGKGVACMAMVILILSPISFVILLALFIALVLMTKYVSLGSIMGAFFYPIIQFAFYPQHGWITLSSILTMLLVVFMHRENIKRLMAGKESKVSFGSRKNKEKNDGEGSKNDNS